MIKLENIVLPSPQQMKFAIEGMRNPLNSWDKSDSVILTVDDYFILGSNDKNLMLKLAKAGPDHRKFLRQMPVGVRITAGHTFWSEFDTYKVGTVRNSCSKMHKIHSASLTYDDFDHEGIEECGEALSAFFKSYIMGLKRTQDNFNETKEKKYWRALIEMLPMGFHLTANVTLNYEILANIYKSRKNHKMNEWITFCKWIETLPLFDVIKATIPSIETPKEKKDYSGYFKHCNDKDVERKDIKMNYLERILEQDATYDEETKVTSAYIKLTNGKYFRAKVKPCEEDFEKANKFRGWHRGILKATANYLKEERDKIDIKIFSLESIYKTFEHIDINVSNDISKQIKEAKEESKEIRRLLRDCYREFKR